MRIDRAVDHITIQAPAKLNLFFEVLGKRSDGYHEIETLMCPIDLYDTLSFRKEPNEQLKLQCESVPELGGPDRTDSDRTDPLEAGKFSLPSNQDNLVLQAVERLRRDASVTSGATLRLVKRIPIAAGLGGGSSDAAAALRAANEVWRLDRSAEDLSETAARLGSDVPFFLAEGPAICRGRGEIIEPLDDAVPLHFVLVRPPVGLSTADVYGVCRPSARPRRVDSLLDAFRKGDIAAVGRLLFNRLQPAAESLSPWITRLSREFSELGFLGHGMSGSGSSYFGLCRHAKEARHLARRLRARGAGSAYAVRSCR